MSTESQLESYDDLQSTIGKKQIYFYQIISEKKDGVTLFELVALTGLPINRISGRVSELRKMGKVYDSGKKRINPLSGKSGTVWMASHEI